MPKARTIEELIQLVAHIEGKLADQRRAILNLPPKIAPHIETSAQILITTTKEWLVRSRVALAAARARLH
ncbi:hypothetical protein [Roseococcus sp. YIM B11640]|uniref:hypothetical protein n=1 Tax=Roseococcus sp. YIM B11640 TaxID=3133973 RepID=UPI003C7B3719